MLAGRARAASLQLEKPATGGAAPAGAPPCHRRRDRPSGSRPRPCPAAVHGAVRAAVREAAAEIFAIYGQLPSYRAMLDREGAASPGDVAIIGNEEEVVAGLEDMARAGATDFVALEFGRTADEFAQTRPAERGSGEAASISSRLTPSRNSTASR